MAEHVYKVIELVGSSEESFEKAAVSAIEAAGSHLEGSGQIAEITAMDMQISEGKVIAFRTKVKVSFRYHQEV